VTIAETKQQTNPPVDSKLTEVNKPAPSEAGVEAEIGLNESGRAVNVKYGQTDRMKVRVLRDQRSSFYVFTVHTSRECVK
jgi:hypothetical protein